MSKLNDFIKDLRRRKVFKVASVYAVTAWAISLGAAELFPAFGIPEWTIRLVVIAAVLGLPIAVVMAWVLEVTPTGIVLDEHKHSVVSRDEPAEAGSVTTSFSASHSVTVSWMHDENERKTTFFGSFTLGRENDCEVTLDDSRVSRRHARIYFHQSQWLVEDLDSRNGTFLNGEPINKAPLNDSSTLQFSDGGPKVRIYLGNNPDETVIAG